MQPQVPNPLEAARKGNPDAIAALMNRSLAPKGIVVKVALKEACLSVLLEAAQTPDQQTLVPLIHKGLNALNLEQIKTVRLYGQQKESEFPEWQHEFSLNLMQETTEPSSIVRVQSASIQPVKPVRTNSTSIYQQKPSGNRNVLIVASGLVVTVLLGVGGWIGWTQSIQASTLSQARKMVQSIPNVEAHADLNALKGDQKQLNDNQQKLQDAIALLNNAPKLPILNSKVIDSEIGNIQTQTTANDQQIKEVNQKVEALEKLLPAIKEVSDKFSALNSSLDVGMNYKDYGQQVRELKVALDKLEKQPGAAQHPAFASLTEAFTEYNFALKIWRYYIDSSETLKFFPIDSPYGLTLVTEYGVDAREIGGTSYIYLDDALASVWKRAQKSIDKTQKSIS